MSETKTLCDILREYPRDDQAPHVAADSLEQLEAENEKLREALKDILSGWRYIRDTHGDLYGVGWERVETKVRKALGKEDT